MSQPSATSSPYASATVLRATPEIGRELSRGRQAQPLPHSPPRQLAQRCSEHRRRRVRQLVAGTADRPPGLGTRVARRVETTIRRIGRDGRNAAAALRPAAGRQPDLASFPVAAWTGAMRRSLARAPATAFGYGDPRGRPGCGWARAAYLARCRSRPDHVVVCSGFGQALALSARCSGRRPRRSVERARPGRSSVWTCSPWRSTTTVPRVEGLTDQAAVVPHARAPVPGSGPALAPRRARWSGPPTGAATAVEDDVRRRVRTNRAPSARFRRSAPTRSSTSERPANPSARASGWPGWSLPRPGGPSDCTAKEYADFHPRRRAADAPPSSRPRAGTTAASAPAARLPPPPRRPPERRRVRARRSPSRQSATGLHALLALGQRQQGGRRGRPRLDGRQAGRVRGQPGATRRGQRSVVGYATPPDHAYTGALARLSAAVLRDTTHPRARIGLGAASHQTVGLSGSTFLVSLSGSPVARLS